MSQDYSIKLKPKKRRKVSDDIMDDIVAEVIDAIGDISERRNLPLNDEFAQDMAIAMRFVRAGYARQLGLESDVIQEEMTKLADIMLK